MRIRRRQVGAGLGVASLFGAMTLVVAPTTAGASTALCGATIMVSTTLTEDVGPCPNDGIQVGANNITLNLAGHTVFGTPQALDGKGIWVDEKTGVTIRGGGVRGFDAGVVLISSSGNLITQIVARDNIGAPAAAHGTLATALGTGLGDGILLIGSSNNRLIQNVVERNGPFNGIGLVGNSDGNLVQANVVQYNNLALGQVQQDDGIRLQPSIFSTAPDRNIVTGNTVRNNGRDGIGVLGPAANDNQILNNVVDHNGFEGNVRRGDGIHIYDRVLRTIVTGNRVVNNARNGILIEATVGNAQNPSPAMFNRISRNVVVYNGLDPGEDLASDIDDGNRLCDSNTWTQNIHFTEGEPGSDCLN